MLDREVVKEFVKESLDESGNLPLPKNIREKDLIEAFCQFTEDDYYEWLKDNYKTFFNHNNPDWDWIKNYIANRIKSELTE